MKGIITIEGIIRLFKLEDGTSKQAQAPTRKDRESGYTMVERYEIALDGAMSAVTLEHTFRDGDNLPISTTFYVTNPSSLAERKFLAAGHTMVLYEEPGRNQGYSGKCSVCQGATTKYGAIYKCVSCGCESPS